MTERDPAAGGAGDPGIIALGRGYYWNDLQVGQRFATIRRTINEHDLAAFVGLAGMFAEGFLNGVPGSGPLAGRPVPGALSYAMIEGMLVQTMLSGTGQALLESRQVMHAPVQVGDTIRGIVEITGIRPTSGGNRAVVGSSIRILNQRDECVITYETTRMWSGRPQA